MSFDEVYFEKSYFGTVRDDYGGAIFIDSQRSLKAEMCTFECCIARIEGGAIYFSGTKLLFTKNCAETCFIPNPVDEKFGNFLNAICTLDSSFTQSTLYLCGPKVSYSTDSTVAILSNGNEMKSCNYTECNSEYGTSGPFLRSAGTVSDISVFNGTAYYSFVYAQSVNSKRIINVETQINNRVLGTFDSCEVEDSIFLITCSPLLLFHGDFHFTNCYGNFETTGISLTNMKITNNIHRCFDNHQTCQKRGIFWSLPKCTTLLIAFLSKD